MIRCMCEFMAGVLLRCVCVCLCHGVCVRARVRARARVGVGVDCQWRVLHQRGSERAGAGGCENLRLGRSDGQEAVLKTKRKWADQGGRSCIICGGRGGAAIALAVRCHRQVRHTPARLFSRFVPFKFKVGATPLRIIECSSPRTRAS